MLFIYLIVAVISGFASSHLTIGLLSHINWIKSALADPILISTGAWRIISIVIAIRLAFAENTGIKNGEQGSGDEFSPCLSIPLWTFFITLFLILIATIFHYLFYFVGYAIAVIVIVVVVLVLMASGEL